MKGADGAVRDRLIFSVEVAALSYFLKIQRLARAMSKRLAKRNERAMRAL
jgi:hypothetical protein